ncbi:actin family [Cryptosporidium sp. chipmunk genotype I]|uniref:actin family n=1 Tax=Cryptosporidium sp. chipmunk genotype I TaxID=1280935 RepID=UPI003519E03B|nr:actin family [Cryptosporidium sp. chipmunk genotype I]
MSDVLLSSGIGNQSSSIILDIGTQSIRVGYGGDDLPRSIVPTCIGIPNKEVDVIDSNRFCNTIFPLKPWEKRDYIEVLNPFQYNFQEKTIEINEEYLTKIIQELSLSQKFINSSFSYSTSQNYIFEPLDDKMNGHTLLIPIHSISNPNHSTKLAEIAFEKLEVASLFTSRRPVLSCFACGRTSGVVVDIGASASNVSCVQDGHCIQGSIQEYPVAGDFLDNEIYKKIHSKASIIPEFGIFKSEDNNGANGYHVPLTNVDQSYLNWGVMHVIREIKHSSLSFPNQNSNDNEFHLPDGSIIDTTSIRNTIPNLLFKPGNSSQGYPGIVQMVVNSIIETSNINKEISNITSSIILAGGTTLINGFDAKLHQGIIDHKPSLIFNNSVSLHVNQIANLFSISAWSSS